MTLPDVRDLGHGISVIPLPLPFPSPAWVNTYVLRADLGLLLIDCGVDWTPGFDALLAGFGQLGLNPSDVHTLVVSHLHPDHVGMAPRLIRELGCRLVMHRNAAGGVGHYNNTHQLVSWTMDFGSKHGVPQAEAAAFGHFDRPDWMPQISEPAVVVDDGDRIPLDENRFLEVLHTPGHEHSHICLRDSKTGILFSGDHILGRITPVIMWDHTETDVLALYLESVCRLVDLGIGLTYPAHGSIVERGAQRGEQIQLHHQRRLNTMEEIIDLAPATAWQVMRKAFRPHLNSLEQRLALRETVSHLEHLVWRDRLTTFEEDATRWYRGG